MTPIVDLARKAAGRSERREAAGRPTMGPLTLVALRSWLATLPEDLVDNQVDTFAAGGSST